MKSKVLWKRVVAVLILLTTLLSVSSIAFANDDDVHSIYGDLKNGVLTKGHLSDTSLIELSREKKEEIANNGGNASLYDRFGDNIEYVGYLGEFKIQIGLLDKLYTMMIGNSRKSDIQQIKDAIYMLFNEIDAGVTNVVYQNRADILNNNTDPRYRAYKNDIITAYKVGKANIKLKLANMINAFERLLIGDKIIDFFIDIYNLFFNSSIFDKLKEYANVIIAMCMILFIIRFGLMITRVLREKDSKKRIFYYIGNAFITMLIILAFAISPLAFVNFYDDYRNFTNQIITDSLDGISIDNPVVNGSENIVDANIWYITIFDPWCRGMFGRGFDECYSPNDGRGTAYPLSNDDIGSASLTDTKASCVEMIGDIKVNSADGEIQNIAALAYSCQSVYHVDTSTMSYSNEWPNAARTVYNKSIYADDFKWVDALMNISCEWISATETTGSLMTDGDSAVRGYDCSNMEPYSWLALYRTIVLLLPLTIASVATIAYFCIMFLSFLRMVFYSFRFLIDPDNQAIIPHLKLFLTSAVDYFFSIITKGVIIVLFIKLYDSFLNNLIYFIVSIIFFLGSKGLTNSTRRMKNRIRMNFNKYLNEIQKELDDNEEKKNQNDSENDEDSNEDEDNSDDSDNVNSDDYDSNDLNDENDPDYDEDYDDFDDYDEYDDIDDYDNFDDFDESYYDDSDESDESDQNDGKGGNSDEEDE